MLSHGSYSIYILSCVSFMSCAVFSACHIHVLQSVQLMQTCEATCVAACLLPYPAGPACWQSVCLSSVSGTSPSRLTWSGAVHGRGAHPEISERNTCN